MTDQRSLTFGDDSSAGADLAWAWISNHAWPGWRLDVVTAQQPAGAPKPGDAALRPWDPPRPRQPGPDEGWAEVRHLTAHVDARVALMGPTDLLVIGPRGPGLLKALHLGSTAEWFLQHPPSPVLVARDPAPTRRALLCPDGSPHALAAVTAFAHLPWAGEVDAVVLVVDDGRSHPGVAEEAIAVLEGAGIPVRQLTASGKPTPAILDAVADEDVDLVVLGTRGLTGLARLRVGSTAGAVSRAAPCPVLLACADDANPPNG